MTSATAGKRPEELLHEVLGYDVLCSTYLDYTLAAYLGRDIAARLVLEPLIERQPQSWKRKTLDVIIEQERLGFPPFDGLTADLALLSDFRNRFAHSQPDHGDVLRRLRRYRGANQPVWLISENEIVEQFDRGMRCHSQLDALYGRLIERIA